jgi:hypothetical protein
VSVLVLIDPASIAVSDKMGSGVGMDRLDCGGVNVSQINVEPKLNHI